MTAALNLRHKRGVVPRLHCVWVLLLAGVVAGATSAQVNDTRDYLQRMDLDGDGRVSVDEYVQWMLYAFDRMDRNGDGVLTTDELPGGRGQPVTREQQRRTLIERFHKQDADGDGYLSVRELSAAPR